MAVTTAQTTDLAQVLGDMLAAVEGIRVYTYVADVTRPPANGGAVVIGLPTIDWQDEQSGFCYSMWEFPLAVVTTRSNDLAAQQHLSRLVRDVAQALSGPVPDGVFSIQLVDARPGSTTIAGAEYPSYSVRCELRA